MQIIENIITFKTRTVMLYMCNLHDDFDFVVLEFFILKETLKFCDLFSLFSLLVINGAFPQTFV